MMLYKAFLLFLLAAPRNTASLSCFSCKNAGSLKGCNELTTCSDGQSCFQSSLKKGDFEAFSLGCTQNENCGDIPVYSNVSKLRNGQQIEECKECCGYDKCNKKLCKYSKPPPCSDVELNCAFWNNAFNVCKDIQSAKRICRKFCKLCDLVDGNWASWSPWSPCDVTCGKGKHTRTRTCTDPAPAYKGLDCEGSITDYKPCIRPLCPVHGGWSDWLSWETCPVTCGAGIQKRHRTCTNPSPLRHGDHCFGDAMDVKLCEQKPCDVSNGGWSAWNEWGICSESCGKGFKTRSRSCTNPEPGIYGKPCIGDPMKIASCNKEECSSTATVAFSSYHVTDCSPAKDQTMIFSKVLMNEGGAFNNNTGIFVAPRNGIYTFYAQLCSRNMHFDIMVENIAHATKYAYQYGTGAVCPSAQAIAQLKTGDKVFVQWKTWSHSLPNFIYQGVYYRNSFSGKYSSP